MKLPIQIWLCLGLLTYYTILQLYSSFVRSGMKTNSKNRTIEELRTKYKVTIKTFRGNDALKGFSWFKSIWLNEILFKKESALLYAFHHEYYHLKHRHKFWTLFMRFIISISPLTVYFVNWFLFVVILLVISYVSEKIREEFEDKANEYASKITNVSGKRTA